MKSASTTGRRAAGRSSFWIGGRPPTCSAATTTSAPQSTDGAAASIRWPVCAAWRGRRSRRVPRRSTLHAAGRAPPSPRHGAWCASPAQARPQRRGRDRQQLIVGRAPPILVKMRSLPIELFEGRPLFGGGIEHRRMRGSSAENDASHGSQSWLAGWTSPVATPKSYPDGLRTRSRISIYYH
jgi:hypothetical protein